MRITLYLFAMFTFASLPAAAWDEKSDDYRAPLLILGVAD